MAGKFSGKAQIQKLISGKDSPYPIYYFVCLDYVNYVENDFDLFHVGVYNW
jgi:hypothetical protein